MLLLYLLNVNMKRFMVSNNIRYGILLFFLLPVSLDAQNEKIQLSLEQSVARLHADNKSLQIAGKGVELARNEHQKLNAFWYPSVTAAGAFVHMSNPIEVHQSLNKYTDPAIDFVETYLPDNDAIVSILQKIGQNTFTLPLISQNLTSIDANVVWPVFTGGKRVYAGRIGRTMVDLAETTRSEVGAVQHALLVETYFGVRLGERVVDVREETYEALRLHYEHALKLEQNGMINKAERLLAEVSMKEARRELESARKDLTVAGQALKSLLSLDTVPDIQPTTALFINTNLPSASYFKIQLETGNYLVRQLRLQQTIADNELKIGRAAYFPNIALFGKQTLYNHGADKYLLPRTMVGVGFTWNIFDGFDREKRIRQAKITGQSLALGKEKAISDLEVAVDKLYTQLQNALDNVEALHTTIDMSRELVRIRRKSFQEGMATSTEVVDAQVVLSKVKMAFLLAYYQYDVALANLLAVCGTPETFQAYKAEGHTEDFLFPNE